MEAREDREFGRDVRRGSRARCGLALALGATLWLAGCGAVEPRHARGAATSKPIAAGGAAPIPASFRWRSTEPLVSAHADAAHPLIAIKDPSVVFFEKRWHVFATTGSSTGAWNLTYLNFSDWSEAARAEQHAFDEQPSFRGYHAAPQVFFFRPQQRWYLIFQSGQPQYSTTRDIGNPASWTAPADFFAREPDSVRAHQGAGGWLDFWNICDERYCYLFFSDDNGQLFRSRTRLEDFPHGFDEPVIALEDAKDALYESSAVYRIEGTHLYLAMVEAVGRNGRRFFRSFTSEALDGVWSPLAATWENPFAGPENVTFPGERPWTRDISHGELLRTNYDETPTIALSGLRFLYQGFAAGAPDAEYSQIPWQLALLTLSD